MRPSPIRRKGGAELTTLSTCARNRGWPQTRPATLLMTIAKLLARRCS
jgi:hypothetical protein